MKIEPRSFNAIKVITENGQVFVIADVDELGLTIRPDDNQYDLEINYRNGSLIENRIYLNIKVAEEKK